LLLLAPAAAAPASVTAEEKNQAVRNLGGERKKPIFEEKEAPYIYYGGS
jgi:hypothetical protein